MRAYNEAETLADTLRSLRRQTLPAAEIVVVDDCSTDETAQIAEPHGVTVLRPHVNTGSKAGAQTFALGPVRTDLVMAVDADTTSFFVLRLVNALFMLRAVWCELVVRRPLLEYEKGHSHVARTARNRPWRSLLHPLGAGRARRRWRRPDRLPSPRPWSSPCPSCRAC